MTSIHELRHRKWLIAFALALPLYLLMTQTALSNKPMSTVNFVNLNKFMGTWYVIACIPTLIERDSYNAVEHYQLKDDGTVSTTFTYLKGGFNGPLKSYRPRGFILDHQTNATWGMQFIWPIKADFRIVSLDEQYTQTIVARQKRDYVWLMARTPNISQQDYQQHVHTIESLGYDITKLRKVPQKWPSN